MYSDNVITRVADFLSEINVYDLGLKKIRIGNQGDGGYIAAKELCESTKVVFSFGIGDDVSFEKSFAENYRQFCLSKLFAFDPFIKQLPTNTQGIEWKAEKVESLDDIVKYNGKNALLKMDIEWDEWDLLQNTSTVILERFSQIIIELHVVHIQEVQPGVYSPYFTELYQKIYDRHNEQLFLKYTDVMRRLNQFFFLFHIHANNSLPEVNLGEQTFPPLLELSWVRKDLARYRRLTKEEYPIIGLDFQNKDDRPDIEKVYPF